jgi:hypothetical protein
MATRQDRLDEFRQDTPPLRRPVELLCEDHCGTYALPFPCEWADSVAQLDNPGDGRCICHRLARMERLGGTEETAKA